VDRIGDLDFLVIEPEVTDRATESVRLRRVLNAIPAAFDVVVVSQDLADRRSKVPGTMLDRALLSAGPSTRSSRRCRQMLHR
jgi:hypothetical protein